MGDITMGILLAIELLMASIATAFVLTTSDLSAVLLMASVGAIVAISSGMVALWLLATPDGTE